MTVGSLFAGIGGFDLGFERAGYEIKWQVEIDDYCRRVLERHFPRAERFGDIRTLDLKRLSTVDVIAGGFPCQDISLCGDRAGIEGQQSGLWHQMFSAIRVVQPRFVVVENVAGIRSSGLGEVLGDLARIGYDSEWECIPCCYFGAPHPRERLFIVAYTQKERRGWCRRIFPCSTPLEASGCDQELLRPWAIESSVPRVAYGIPRRVDRVGAIGNSVSPAIVQWIAQRIKEVSNHVSG